MQETERAIERHIVGLTLNTTAMAAASNIHRAANLLRNYLERGILREAGLTWTGFVTLWVAWIWDGPDMGRAAEEVGVSKGTLSGVVKTLSARGLVERRIDDTDRRSIRLFLTDRGRSLMVELFPRFNQEEAAVMSGLDRDAQEALALSLRGVIATTESIMVSSEER
jgi:DNA-binding MarR family transcriptional regulator